MKVLNRTPLTLAEVKEAVKTKEESITLQDYLKKFTVLSKQKALDLKKEIIDLDNPKIKEQDAVKVADFLPKNSEEVLKIFTDVSLSEEEINQILDIVKKYNGS